MPVKEKLEGYGGRSGSFPWGKNVYEIPADEVAEHDFDCILFQFRQNYQSDQFEILTEKQRQLPKIYLEHDPPRESPTDTRHPVDDPNMLLVHVTHFNRLMWDNNRTPAVVIDHGVTVPANARYSGEINKGIVVVNNIKKRGRRLGLDIFEYVQQQVPLDLIGMGAAEAGGIGEVPHDELPEFIARYRFFFNPIRYTSLGLSVLEAMMLGLPIVGLATTEMATAIENGRNGYIETDIEKLIAHMKRLLDEPAQAKQISAGAADYARQRFSIDRFARDWERTFNNMAKRR